MIMLPFDYQVIKRPRRKTASISVKPDSSVLVVVPDTLPELRIAELVNKKRHWIERKLKDNEEIKRKSKPKQYISGEAFSYLGRNYRLKIIDVDAGDVKLMNGRFYVPVPSGLVSQKREGLIIERLSQWYKVHALERLRDKTKRYAAQLDVLPAYVGIKDYKSRWGSCTNEGDIFFNWYIIMAPHSIIDYVVAHELCHLIHKDHSKRFWKLLGSVISDYLDRKQWLKINGVGLILKNVKN